MRRTWPVLLTLLLMVLAVGCRARPVPPVSPAVDREATITPTPSADSEADPQAATLASLAQVDDYPLYTMRYHGDYAGGDVSDAPGEAPAWACSLFATLADEEQRLYGRNFDWDFSPALLLFTDPPDGYASVSMVDLAFLGFDAGALRDLTALSPDAQAPLLATPAWPFDGMNARGLAVGMAAVPDTEVPHAADRPTLGSLGVIREMLDHAATVDEALEILAEYNVDMRGGPHIHYLIADAGGQAALVEFFQGEMHVIPNEAAWHVATNFYVTGAGDVALGRCWRYDAINARLGEAAGRLAVPEALSLLSDVAQDSTQWSVVYDMSAGAVHVVMGRAYDTVHRFAVAAE